MPESKRYEFSIEPISGWEVRTLNTNLTYRVLGLHIQTGKFIEEEGVTIRYRGTIGNFRMRWVDPLEPTWNGTTRHGRPYARVAGLSADEINSSVGGNQNQIVYINRSVPTPPLTTTTWRWSA